MLLCPAYSVMSFSSFGSGHLPPCPVMLKEETGLACQPSAQPPRNRVQVLAQAGESVGDGLFSPAWELLTLALSLRLLPWKLLLLPPCFAELQLRICKYLEGGWPHGLPLYLSLYIQFLESLFLQIVQAMTLVNI